LLHLLDDAGVSSVVMPQQRPSSVIPAKAGIQMALPFEKRWG
jgi:hypothetical protein